MAVKFYECTSCEAIFALLSHTKDKTICSESTLKEAKSGTTDGAQEKHVPVVKADGTHVTVLVGEAEHPMLEEHYIEWIAIETETGMQIKYLTPDGKPHAEFILTEHEKPVAAYEYCNIHGLWKKEI